MHNDSERLRPFVASLVLEWLRDTPTSTWRPVDGSLAFVDISGFTRLTERLASRGKAGAEEMSDILDRTFAELLGIASSFGGRLVKWGGDALLLLYDGECHAERACTASDGMRRALRRIGNLRTSVGPVKLKMSVGIHSAPLDFFLVGSRHRELIVSGPAATETARMETIAEAGEIVVSACTAALLPRDVVGAAKEEGFLLARSPAATPIHQEAVEATNAVAAAIPRQRDGEADDLRGAMPASIRDFLLAGGTEGEHRHIAVAFVQFGGVDAMLAAEGAAMTAEAINAVVSSCQEAAERHGVTFWETDINADGGKVMLVCGAPVTHEDDEDRMLATAREIVDTAGPLWVRIGVNNGRVFSIEFGPPYRRTYSVKGDAVNLAARLMAKSTPGEILASAGVVARSRGVFATEPLEPFMVKGKVRPVQAHRVLEARGIATPPPLDNAPVQVMVGRDRELTALEHAWERARSGAGQAFVVVGEPGMGKSRLVAAAAAAVHPHDVWLVHGDEYHSTSAYAPFRRLFRAIAGIADVEDSAAVAWALHDAVAQRAPELVPWLPLVAAVAGVDLPPTPETAGLDEQFRKARREQVTVAMLRAMLPESCLLAFEDMHLMDDASRDLIRRVMSEAHASPWLVLATTRAEADAPGGATCLTLGPLSPAESRRAVAELTDEAPLPPHVIQDIAIRAGGNPLFLTELVATVGRGEETVELPNSVEAIVAAQIDGLPPPDRALLRAAAVLGGSVELDVLSAMLAPDAQAADPAKLQGLSRFVDVVDEQLRFRNALTRETAYEGLPFSRRKVLHERAAVVLERRAADATDDVAAELSLHYFHAERYEDAWRYARRAGERAQSLSAHAEAAGLFARALASARHLPAVAAEADAVRVALGDARFRLGDFAAARAAYRAARRSLVGDPVELARLQLKIAQATDRMGALSDSLRWLSRGRTLLATSAGSRTAAQLRADIAAQYALVKHFQGRERDAVRWSRRAITEARASGARHAEAAAALYLDVSETLLGRGDGSAARQALAIWQELGDAWQEARTHNQLGIRAYYAGDWTEALACYERAREASVRAGDEWMAAIAAGNIAEILSDQGRLDEAEPLLRDALALWRASGAESSIAFARSYLGRIAARAGRHDDALTLYTQARQGFAADGEHAEVVETDARIAECLVFRGDAQRALVATDLALARADAVDATASLPLLHRSRGLALVQSGDRDSGYAALQESLRIARARGAEHEAAWTLDALLSTFPDLDEQTRLADERDTLLRRLGIIAVTRAPLAPVLLDLTGVPARSDPTQPEYAVQ